MDELNLMSLPKLEVSSTSSRMVVSLVLITSSMMMLEIAREHTITMAINTDERNRSKISYNIKQ